MSKASKRPTGNIKLKLKQPWFGSNYFMVQYERPVEVWVNTSLSHRNIWETLTIDDVTDVELRELYHRLCDRVDFLNERSTGKKYRLNFKKNTALVIEKSVTRTHFTNEAGRVECEDYEAWVDIQPSDLTCKHLIDMFKHIPLRGK